MLLLMCLMVRLGSRGYLFGVRCDQGVVCRDMAMLVWLCRYAVFARYGSVKKSVAGNFLE